MNILVLSDTKEFRHHTNSDGSREIDTNTLAHHVGTHYKRSNDNVKWYCESWILNNNLEQALLHAIAHGPYDLIIGRGLSGVLAIFLGAQYQCRTVLIDPVYPIWQYDELYSLPSECWDQLFYIQRLLEYSDTEAIDNIFLILNKDDDLIDTKRMAAYFHEGNTVIVNNSRNLSGEDFERAFDILVTNLDRNSSFIREALASGSSDVVPKDSICEGNTHGPNEEGEEELDSLEEDFDESALSSVAIDKVDISNGNVIIEWSVGDSGPKQSLYLYFQNGQWYHDEKDREYSEDLGIFARDIINKASTQLARQFAWRCEAVEHEAEYLWQ